MTFQARKTSFPLLQMHSLALFGLEHSLFLTDFLIYFASIVLVVVLFRVLQRQVCKRSEFLFRTLFSILCEPFLSVCVSSVY